MSYRKDNTNTTCECLDFCAAISQPRHELLNSRQLMCDIQLIAFLAHLISRGQSLSELLLWVNVHGQFLLSSSLLKYGKQRRMLSSQHFQSKVHQLDLKLSLHNICFCFFLTHCLEEMLLSYHLFSHNDCFIQALSVNRLPKWKLVCNFPNRDSVYSSYNFFRLLNLSLLLPPFFLSGNLCPLVSNYVVPFFNYFQKGLILIAFG